MSLRGRYVIDRIKRSVSGYLRLPVPPYDNPSYWEGAYRSFGPNDVFEWGEIRCKDLLRYHYKLAHHTVRHHNVAIPGEKFRLETDLQETFGVTRGNSEGPTLILGCGNSKFGEDMIEEANWEGPIIQVDVSSRIVDSMNQRSSPIVGEKMKFVQDDATILSAFESNAVRSAFDKGLVDALFCADAFDQCFDVMKAVHRVLLPGGHFVFLSFSRPEFILDKLLLSRRAPMAHRGVAQWDDVQVRELDRILLYRFRKPNNATTEIKRMPRKHGRGGR